MTGRIRMRWCWGLACAVLGFWITNVLAMASNPYREGDEVGEPFALENIRVTEERLHLDATGLKAGASESPDVRVWVSYTLVYDGASRRVSPVFMAPNQSFSAQLDGRDLPVEFKDNVKLPDPPQETSNDPQRVHDPSSESTGDRIVSQAALLDFELSPGTHVLTVSYVIQAGLAFKEGVTLRYLLDYGMAPARDRTGFRNLSLTLDVPEGWHIESTPTLQRGTDAVSPGPSVSAKTGRIMDDRDVEDDPLTDSYSARFVGVPADEIQLKIWSPTTGWYWLVYAGTRLIFLGVLIYGGFGIARAVRGRVVNFWFASGQDGVVGPLPFPWWLMLGGAAIWALAILMTWYVASQLPQSLLETNQIARYRLVDGLMWLVVIFFSILALPVAAVIARVADRSARRRFGM